MSPDNPNQPAYSFKNLPDKDYRESKGLSKSMLSHFLKSPAHYKQALETPTERTKAMNFGVAFHAEILLDDPSKEYAIQPEADGRTKEGKAIKEKFAADNEGKTIISQEEGLAIAGMADSVREHSFASSLLENKGASEFSVFAEKTDNVHQPVKLKGRLDAFDETTGIIFDLKSCEDASPEGARKAIRMYRYDIQAVHYMYLILELQKIGAIEWQKDIRFFFVFVEKTAPWAVGVYELGNSTLNRARKEWEDSINDFSMCEKSDWYPAYSPNSEIIEL